MREASYINNLWQAGGPFIGPEGKPHTRVTVQVPWEPSDPAVKNGDEDHVIHPTVSRAGNFASRGVPVRWYQKKDNSQVEKEIPNIKIVDIDRSIETDAATCNITLYNQWMYENGGVPTQHRSEGNRSLAGFFNPSRGQYPESQARWGHTTNEWEDVLVPNAVLRTYQGYGGHDKTLEQCLEDGHLILTGVWLVDESRFSTNAELVIECRDMAKLLVEQQLFPPLVPASKYPLTYYRWVYDNFAVSAAATTVGTDIAVGDKRTVYRDSSTDRWYGPNALLHGHRGTDSLDGNVNTFWLSVGNAGPDRLFATDWIEFDVGEYMNAVYVHTWAGNYEMYVSVMENGVWQGAATVPYDPSELYATQDVVNTGANIPYVQMYGTPWEGAQEYLLDRAYLADRVRISFRHLAYSGLGPWQYRAGVREFRARGSNGVGAVTGVSTTTIQPFFFAGESLRNPADSNATGYLTASQMGQIDAFGDLRILESSGGDAPSAANVYGSATTSTGDGYWILRADGRITTYGAATYYGSPYTDGTGETGGADGLGGRWAAICKTPSNLGYWAVAVDGRIRAYGDATPVADLPGGLVSSSGWISDAASAPSGAQALWICHTNGTVYTRAGAANYGGYSGPAETGNSRGLHGIRSTMDGSGYWLVSGAGLVEAKGSAVHYGEAAGGVDPATMKTTERIMPTGTDLGYWLFFTDGTMVPFGDADNFGSPIPGSTGQLRKDGNYLDYADIIKDLALWSGFLLYDDALANNDPPQVYGNIETTGAFSKQKLPDDIFDKRPVIDAMTEIKETVGYLLFVDDEGGFRFESPNFWSFGNTIQSTGQRVYELPEIDEEVSLFEYGTSRNDASLRSLIIISSEDPNEAGDSTVTTKIVPQTASGLRGLLKPAMWVNGWFQDPIEQRITANLIALHIWFAQRLGQVTASANPAIQINDQVRIYERQTDEVFIHYVRGVHTTHDLDTGEYTMTLTTHWLGTGEDWAITDNPAYIEDEAHFVLEQDLVSWLQTAYTDRGAEFILGFQNANPSYKGIDPNGPDGDPGAGAADG